MRQCESRRCAAPTCPFVTPSLPFLTPLSLVAGDWFCPQCTVKIEKKKEREQKKAQKAEKAALTTKRKHTSLNFIPAPKKVRAENGAPRYDFTLNVSNPN